MLSSPIFFWVYNVFGAVESVLNFFEWFRLEWFRLRLFHALTGLFIATSFDIAIKRSEYLSLLFVGIFLEQYPIVSVLKFRKFQTPQNMVCQLIQSIESILMRINMDIIQIALHKFIHRASIFYRWCSPFFVLIWVQS